MEEQLIAITANIITDRISAITSSLKGELNKFWLKNVSLFTHYLESANKKYESTKTLLYKDQAVPIRDIYVGTNIERNKKTIAEEKFLKDFLDGQRCVVTATAGAGKSFFAKSIFLRILQESSSIPLFVELKNLNNSDSGFIDYLVNDFKSNFKIDMPRETLLQLIEKGKFSLILDGYDELTNEKIKKINIEIQSLDARFSEASVLITTRPGSEELEFLSGFTTYKIKPLTQEQAIKLVNKLKYDETVKSSFLARLNSGLFKQHKDFLSNPLLLTIMLMTYSDLAEIPSKMHIFYEQAFDTLFYRHDSSKGMYRRELKSELAIDDFKDILSCVSASSYIRGQISLTNTDLISYIRKAKKLANISKSNPKNYIEDLVQSVCILLEDGKKYTYNHRSFQEYFAALFLIQFPTDSKMEVYKIYLERGQTDSALNLAFEMNQSFVETDFIKPMLRELLNEINSPEDLLFSWMEGIELVRQKYQGSGKTKELGKPQYRLHMATSNWNFQCYVENMYPKATKKFVKFSRLTKKSFIEEFGNGHYSQLISINDIDHATLELFKRLGILEIAKMRLELLKWLYKDICSRDERTKQTDIEKWL